jgi:phosphoglycerate-specific signal transduction histidine kinase
MDDQAIALLTEIRDLLKSIDDRLNPKVAVPAGVSSVAEQIEHAVRDLANNINKLVRKQ